MLIRLVISAVCRPITSIVLYEITSFLRLLLRTFSQLLRLLGLAIQYLLDLANRILSQLLGVLAALFSDLSQLLQLRQDLTALRDLVQPFGDAGR